MVSYIGEVGLLFCIQFLGAVGRISKVFTAAFSISSKFDEFPVKTEAIAVEAFAPVFGLHSDFQILSWRRSITFKIELLIYMTIGCFL